MTNIIAIWLAALVLVLLALDFIAFDSGAVLFLGRKFLVLVEYVAFWR